jgi:hypothetical protein
MSAANARRLAAVVLAFVAFVALFALALPEVWAQEAPASRQDAKPAQIDKNGLLILIRSTLIALDLSNKSGNYTILREISAPGFAAVNDAARLSALFRTQRERNLDLSGVLVYEPQLTVMPEITKEGLLRFAGVFPSPTSQIRFEMIFAPVNGQWKLFGLAADVVPPGPAAPMPSPPAAPAAKDPASPEQPKRH